MSYSIESVMAICRGGIPREAKAYGIGNGESSVDGQRRAIIQFWEVALSLMGDATLNEADAAFARSEIARHQAELNRLPDFSVRGRILAARQPGQMDLPALATWVGGHNGASVASQHREALAFWREALALKGADALKADDRVFAEGEVARHEQALTPQRESTRPHAKAV